MTFQLNKKDHETFALFLIDNMHDMPYELERSDDWQALYEKKWAYDEESDNFEIYEVRVVQKYQSSPFGRSTSSYPILTV